MTNNPQPDDLRNLWQAQPLESTPMPLSEIRVRASKFERRISRRNLREYVAGLVCLVMFGWYTWKAPNALAQVGTGMIIAGVLFVMWQLHRRGSASTLPEDLGFHASLAFHRRQLVQQRDLLRSVLWWYLAPIVPGVLVSVLAGLPRNGFELRYLSRVAPFLVLLTGTFVGIWWINKAGAARLDRQIQELDRLKEQP